MALPGLRLLLRPPFFETFEPCELLRPPPGLSEWKKRQLSPMLHAPWRAQCEQGSGRLPAGACEAEPPLAFEGTVRLPTKPCAVSTAAVSVHRVSCTMPAIEASRLAHMVYAWKLLTASGASRFSTRCAKRMTS